MTSKWRRNEYLHRLSSPRPSSPIAGDAPSLFSTVRRRHRRQSSLMPQHLPKELIDYHVHRIAQQCHSSTPGGENPGGSSPRVIAVVVVMNVASRVAAIAARAAGCGVGIGGAGSRHIFRSSPAALSWYILKAGGDQGRQGLQRWLSDAKGRDRMG